jgi:hypothetical protein
MTERLLPMMEAARRVGRVPKFITLTQAVDADENPRQARQRVAAAWSRLRRMKAFASRCHGWMAHYEETYSETRGEDGKGTGWHAHVHVVADADFIPHGELAELWFKATGGRGLVVDIRAARKGVERELLKYATKAATLPDDALVLYATTMRGARDITTGGAWHGVVTDDNVRAEDELPADAGPILRFPLAVIEARAAEGDEWAAVVLEAVQRQAVELATRGKPGSDSYGGEKGC